jgi:hydroxymethylpyrimidine/phosphomethylpyrimidine kinase
MGRTHELPAAVTIAGSDSGGGAGIQADLKTFAALGVHGLSVITNVTAQSPKSVRTVEPCGPQIVRSQLETVYGDFRPAATKVGMLYTLEIVRVVARFLRRTKAKNVVIDPVMISTSGRPLLKPGAIEVLRKNLFPLATLITPNVPEAETLSGRRIKSLDDMKRAASELRDQFGCAVLIKGGHLELRNQAVDVLFDGSRHVVVSASRIKGVKTHGTGCTYSAAITACLASGYSLRESVQKAKRYVTKVISRSVIASGHSVLGWNV